MFKIIRRNQKKALAIFSVGLMIVFILPSASQFGSSGPSDAGTLYAGEVKLEAKEYNQLLNEWRVLKQQFQRNDVIPSILGIGANVLDRQDVFAQFQARSGQAIVAQIDDNEELFVLLVKEAQRLGIAASNDAVDTLLARVGLTKGSADYQRLRQPMFDLMSIAAAADRATGVVKVSEPEVAMTKAKGMQEIAANVLEFHAKDFLDKVPAPTPEQVKAQYDKARDTEADASATGFGYKYPHRVKYEAIVIKRDDVKKGVPPIEVTELAEYYRSHLSEFISTTAPSTRPQDAFTLDQGPTTRQSTFPEVKAKIVQTLTDKKADELVEKVRDAVANTMKADYTAYKVARAGGKATTAPASSLGVPYDSKEYLAKLRDKIQQDFKVTRDGKDYTITLTTEREEGWQTAKTLSDPKGGKDAFTTEEGVTFANFVRGRVETFLTAEQKTALASRTATRPVAIWEPTPAFRAAVKGDQMIARMIAAEAAHAPASIDEVKEQVAADVKRAAAYELAKVAAQAALEAAKTGKWLQSVANEQNRTMISTPLFRGERIGELAGLDLKGKSLDTFVQETFKLLNQPPRVGEALRPIAVTRPTTTQASTRPAATKATLATTAATTTKPAVALANTMPAATTAPISSAFKNHPVGLIELPADQRVAVVEIDQLKPMWTQETSVGEERGIVLQQRVLTEQNLRSQWFNYDNVVSRVNYKMPEGREQRTPRPKMPLNPLMGVAAPVSGR